MNIKMPGDKTRAACESCQKFCSATWNYGPFKTKDGLNASGVMQAFCDSCGDSLLIAQQSVYKIRKARVKNKRTSLKLTGPLKDVAYSYVFAMGAEPEKGPELLLKACILAFQEEPDTIVKVLRSVDPKFLVGKKDQKVDVTFPLEMFDQFRLLSEKTGLKVSDVMRRAIWAGHKVPRVDRDVRKLVAAKQTGIL